MKAIVSVFAMDAKGITAYVTSLLAEENINILDISQTVVQDYFNMMMIVDFSKCTKNFEKVGAEMAKLGMDMGLKIRCQKSEIFDKMHRI